MRFPIRRTIFPMVVASLIGSHALPGKLFAQEVKAVSQNLPKSGTVQVDAAALKAALDSYNDLLNSSAADTVTLGASSGALESVVKTLGNVQLRNAPPLKPTSLGNNLPTLGTTLTKPMNSWLNPERRGVNPFLSP